MQNDEAKEFWDRLTYLIGAERPYSWAENRGINKSSFQSAKNRGTKPLPKTIKLWAERIGCNYEWLNNGVGEPYTKESNSLNDPKEKTSVEQEPNLNKDLLIQAFNALESSLQHANKEMEPKGRARFISALYEGLRKDDGIDIHVLSDCIYTIEEALVLRRQLMSSKAKAQLILSIYKLYICNTSDSEVIQSTIKQLVGNFYDGE